MFYVPQLDVDYTTVDDFIHAMIQDAPDPEYALSFLEDILLELFPDIPFDAYCFTYHYWNEYEGPHRIGSNYDIDYCLTALQQAYPEYFI